MKYLNLLFGEIKPWNQGLSIKPFKMQPLHSLFIFPSSRIVGSGITLYVFVFISCWFHGTCKLASTVVELTFYPSSLLNLEDLMVFVCAVWNGTRMWMCADVFPFFPWASGINWIWPGFLWSKHCQELLQNIITFQMYSLKMQNK